MKLHVIKHKNFWYALSSVLFLGSILVWIAIGLNFGIDFTGGSIMEIKYDNEMPAQNEILDKLKTLDLSLSVAATSDNGYILRFKHVEESLHQEIKKLLEPATELRYDSIGPSIGAELKRRTVYATIVVLIAIALYVAYSFRKASYPVASWKYGIVVLTALFHDVIIAVGIFIVLGYYFGIEINTPFIAALLTILGYSVNDTIVVFDRVRENLSRLEGDFETVVDASINQTLTRSVYTSLTTILALVAILLFGGESIRDFVLALIIGITLGTYSSIFIASPLLVTWQQISWKLKRGK